MPTFSISPDECVEETKQYCLEVQNNSSDNCEACMSYSRDNHDTDIEASVETSQEIDDAIEESNEKDKVEEDGDLTVFPWYASNFVFKFRYFRNENR